jgi:hypothetical protein
MIRSLFAAAAFAVALSPVALAQDDTAPKLSSASTIGAILDNPEAKAAFAKAFPEAAENPQLEAARDMTLQDVKGYAPEIFTEEKLKEFDAELAAIK